MNGLFLSGDSQRRERVKSTLWAALPFTQPPTGCFHLKCKKKKWIHSVLTVRFMHSDIMTPTCLGFSFISAAGNWSDIGGFEIEHPHIASTKEESAIKSAALQHKGRAVGGWIVFQCGVIYQAAAALSSWTPLRHVERCAAGSWRPHLVKTGFSVGTRRTVKCHKTPWYHQQYRQATNHVDQCLLVWGIILGRVKLQKMCLFPPYTVLCPSESQ